MPIKYADLHIHTNFSDGTFTPQRVIQEASQKGLSCISITDHDTVSAIEPAKKEAERFGIEVIPGVELSAERDGYEIHIIGYFIDWQAEWFQKKLEQICDVRKRRALTIIEKLKKEGVDLDSDELLRKTAPGSVGRLHIARMLQEKAFVYSLQEAFNKYIGNDCSCYVKKFKLNPAEVIDMIDRLKGLAVLAHPHTIGNDEFIGELAQLGLRGIEVYCPGRDKAAIEHYQNLAKEHGLLITGGSDCHGMGKDRVLMGEIMVPYSLVEALKKEVEVLKSGKS